MANAKTAPKATAAKKAAPAPAPAAQGATRYTMGPWPAKHATGNSIRCYMHKVATALTAQHKQGFTQAQYASALATGLAAWQQGGGKVPSAGFGTAAKPNANCNAHAQWPLRPAQGYLVAVPAKG